MPEYTTMLGWAFTITVSILGAWAAMNARLYEVEARIRLLEAQGLRDTKRNEEYYAQMRNHIDDSIKVTESLIRIESALKLKQDKKFRE